MNKALLLIALLLASGFCGTAHATATVSIGASWGIETSSVVSGVSIICNAANGCGDTERLFESNSSGVSASYDEVFKGSFTATNTTNQVISNPTPNGMVVFFTSIIPGLGTVTVDNKNIESASYFASVSGTGILGNDSVGCILGGFGVCSDCIITGTAESCGVEGDDNQADFDIPSLAPGESFTGNYSIELEATLLGFADSVPEPASATLLGAGLVLLLRRRRVGTRKDYQPENRETRAAVAESYNQGGAWKKRGNPRFLATARELLFATISRWVPNVAGQRWNRE